MKLRPFGDRAVLAELESINAVLSLYRALQLQPLAGVVDLVPAARTVLITFEPRELSRQAVLEWVLQQEDYDDDDAPPDGATVTVGVDYSGPDLAGVASELGISTDEVIALHTSSVWSAAFTGFAPGFAYLVTDHSRLEVPRRTRPRTKVPAGSVGLAAEFSGIYPRESPGGWQLIGRTDVLLWDAAGNPPALITPGVTVRFHAL